ncbi:CopG family transcriptional regulator [Biomaibacter acetigenes]|jgi:CTP:phosphocholine cytidylyltransferase-like protein|uniref:CopG family transcriptional regulator n=1 Tax=Biomaibacter acetigenes TaxID=2316383 RepID=A0A3G2R862_9FIRM|nr:CopG family transcriptional regulator [Biomaibacter acetigenes]AYO31589.1 CopG family transcriptional regulator [Biomaibacter acetigenes]MDN5313072.1 hypothetical protein [Thermoanaerobacteraceae bacterium]
MQYQNITLSIPKELLKKIKHIAIEKQISISALLTKTLEEIVHKEDSYEKAKKHHLSILETGFELDTCGKINWRREDLHER